MILVFVGAGGSAAVDPEQYPTTVGFFERLPEEITQDPLFTIVSEFLGTQKEDGQPIDIEEVLWSLDKLQEYSSLSRDPNTLEGWMMSRGLRRLHANMNAFDGILSGMSEIEGNLLVPLQKRINDLVHEFYVERPKLDKLSNWTTLLQQLGRYGAFIEIFTTNYDLVLETVVGETVINVKTGRQSDSETRLDTTFWDTPSRLERGHGLLTKLHGSVDWQRWNDNIICSRVYLGDQRRHAILYPGYKGEPDQEPFIKFHEHLRTVTQKAMKALFIGFSFRDDYINSILAELPSEIPKFVITKDDPLPDLPFLNGCGHFNGGFTEEAVEACLQHVT